MPKRTVVRPVLSLVLLLAAATVGVTARRARAADIGELLARAEQRGSVRVIAHLDVPATPKALAGSDAEGARLTAIRTARTALARDLDGTAWQMTREFSSIPYVALDLSPEALTAMTLSGAVLDVEEDRLERVMLPESVPLVQGDRAWDAGFDGTDWTIAVLDTGVYSQHPFLAGKVVSEACYSYTQDCPNGQKEMVGEGAGEPCSYAPGSCLHGTHVSGIAAGRGSEFSGVARGANIIAIQVFSKFTGANCDDDVEDPCAKSYTSDTIAAMERVYALRNTYNIAAVNMSLGGGSFSSQAACDQADGARKAAIDQLRSVGIATVAASGNEGNTGAMSAPGCISSVISVGATTKSDQIASFSNSASFLTLLAPGRFILSSVPPASFQEISGTSEATPHVAGAFAILNQKLGRGDVDTVLSALQQTGVPIQDPRNGIVKPRIQIYDALLALPDAGQPSGLQITPDGARTLISKDVGAQRWAITYNPEDDTVTGNVFSPDGGDPKFVWCERTGDNGDPDPYTVQIGFTCSGADACESPSCPTGEWTQIAQVTLPGSFLLPPLAGSSASGTAQAAAASPSANSPSGLQITPDNKRTLISKDVGSERWAITRNPDQTVTGNVFSSDGGEPQFVWCRRTGDDGNPDPSQVLIDYACSGAGRCLASPCTSDQWTAIGDVTLPGSFFLP
ncbi:S8 family serine peptidase [Candidatus Binatia bacterium]|nr:S8 family serine peptidase [Candidatus Binatia bacterium]